MGNTGSRGKKVAPVLAKEVNVSDRDCCCIDRDESVFNRQKSQTSNVNLTRKQLHCHSDYQDENLAEEVDRILEGCESGVARPSKGSFQNSFFKSKIDGLYCGKCNQSPCKTPRDASLSQNEGLHGDHLIFDGLEAKNEVCSEKKPGLVNSHKKNAVADARAGPVCTNTISVPGICNHPSLVLPFVYDASEEDLMNMIEREFG